MFVSQTWQELNQFPSKHRLHHFVDQTVRNEVGVMLVSLKVIENLKIQGNGNTQGAESWDNPLVRLLTR